MSCLRTFSSNSDFTDVGDELQPDGEFPVGFPPRPQSPGRCPENVAKLTQVLNACAFSHIGRNGNHRATQNCAASPYRSSTGKCPLNR